MFCGLLFCGLRLGFVARKFRSAVIRPSVEFQAGRFCKLDVRDDFLSAIMASLAIVASTSCGLIGIAAR
jgi:hypothetical protein